MRSIERDTCDMNVAKFENKPLSPSLYPKMKRTSSERNDSNKSTKVSLVYKVMYYIIILNDWLRILADRRKNSCSIYSIARFYSSVFVSSLGLD